MSHRCRSTHRSCGHIGFTKNAYTVNCIVDAVFGHYWTLLTNSGWLIHIGSIGLCVYRVAQKLTSGKGGSAAWVKLVIKIGKTLVEVGEGVKLKTRYKSLVGSPAL